jgi:threonine dehydratase
MPPAGLDLQLIDEARAYLEPRIRHTPLEGSPQLARAVGGPVLLKLEFLQITGSFKLRGALFYLSKLTPEQTTSGVVACSAGNHGLAVAHATRNLSLPARVYVPSSIDETKYQGLVAFGAEVLPSPHPGYDDTARWAREQEEGSDRTWIPAFDDSSVMAANGGTLAVEILDEVPGTGTLVVPTGGGGLSAGLAYLLKERRPEARFIACQHLDSPGLARSLELGRAITRLPAIETTAGGVEGGLGELCFDVLRSRVDQVVLVSEEEIFEAVRWMLKTHRYLIEPSAAVPVAACLSGRIEPGDGPIVIVLTGRNVGQSVLERILCR